MELIEVINDKKDIDDLNKYLIYGSSTFVKINNDEKRTSLFEFYNKMKKEKRKYKIENMVIKFQNDESGIQLILINIDKKNFIERVVK